MPAMREWLWVPAFVCGMAACNNAVGDGEPVEFPNMDHPLELSGPTGSDGWQSAPPPTPEQCEPENVDLELWAPVPPNTTATFNHELGTAPSLILPYVSFEKTGCRASTGTGDLARVEWADEARVAIRNRTEVNFWMRVVLLP